MAFTGNINTGYVNLKAQIYYNVGAVYGTLGNFKVDVTLGFRWVSTSSAYTYDIYTSNGGKVTYYINGAAQTAITSNLGWSWNGKGESDVFTQRTYTVSLGSSTSFTFGCRVEVTLSGLSNFNFTSTSHPAGVVLPITACGAPTAVSVSATVSEGNVTLSWSGATSGNNNAISSFEIQYSESSNGSSWGGWTALTAVNTSSGSGSVSVSPPDTRGYYRRFQIRTRGAAGASYYSGWAVSSNSVQRARLPTAPDSFSVLPSPAKVRDILTLSWSGAAAGSGTVAAYQIQVRHKGKNEFQWTGWYDIPGSEFNSSPATQKPFEYAFFVVRPGSLLEYQIRAKNSHGLYSGYKSPEQILFKGGIIRIRVGGTWKEGIAYIKDKGIWKEVDSVFVKVNGQWKEST